MKTCDSCGTRKSNDWWLINEKMSMTVCTPCKEIFSGERIKKNPLWSLVVVFFICMTVLATALYISTKKEKYHELEKMLPHVRMEF